MEGEEEEVAMVTGVHHPCTDPWQGGEKTNFREPFGIRIRDIRLSVTIVVERDTMLEIVESLTRVRESRGLAQNINIYH